MRLSFSYFSPVEYQGNPAASTPTRLVRVLTGTYDLRTFEHEVTEQRATNVSIQWPNRRT